MRLLVVIIVALVSGRGQGPTYNDFWAWAILSRERFFSPHLDVLPMQQFNMRRTGGKEQMKKKWMFRPKLHKGVISWFCFSGDLFFFAPTKSAFGKRSRLLKANPSYVMKSLTSKKGEKTTKPNTPTSTRNQRPVFPHRWFLGVEKLPESTGSWSNRSRQLNSAVALCFGFGGLECRCHEALLATGTDVDGWTIAGGSFFNTKQNIGYNSNILNPCAKSSNHFAAAEGHGFSFCPGVQAPQGKRRKTARFHPHKSGF